MSPETLVPVRDPHHYRMRSRIADVAGVMVLELSGEIDFAEIDHLESSFRRARANANGALILDMQRVSFLDLTGMAAIIGALREAELDGCVATVVSAGPRVRRVFALTGNAAALESSSSLVDVPIAASIEPTGEDGGPDG